MEEVVPMPALKDTKVDGYATSVQGVNLGEKEMALIAEALARRAAEQYVRSVVVGYARAPLGRITKQVDMARRLARKAYRNGA